MCRLRKQNVFIQAIYGTVNIILLTGSQLSFLIDGCADGNVCYDIVNASVEISDGLGCPSVINMSILVVLSWTISFATVTVGNGSAGS